MPKKRKNNIFGISANYVVSPSSDNRKTVISAFESFKETLSSAWNAIKQEASNLLLKTKATDSVPLEPKFVERETIIMKQEMPSLLSMNLQMPPILPKDGLDISEHSKIRHEVGAQQQKYRYELGKAIFDNPMFKALESLNDEQITAGKEKFAQSLGMSSLKLPDHYAVLGIPQDTRDDRVIARAFEEKSSQYSSDSKEFQELYNSYATLTNPPYRKIYDEAYNSNRGEVEKGYTGVFNASPDKGNEPKPEETKSYDI